MPVAVSPDADRRDRSDGAVTPRHHRTRLLRTVVAMIAVMLAVEGAARWIEPRVPAVVTWGNPFIQAKSAQLDQRHATTACERILVAGSSVASANVDAGALGDRLETSAYNAGLPSSNIALWNAYLRDVALPRAQPSVVVFAVSPRDSDDNWPRYDSYLDEYHRSRDRRALDGDLRMLEVLERRAETVSAFVRIRSRLRQPGRLWEYLRSGSADEWPAVELDEAGRTMNFADRAFDDDRRRRHIDSLREDLANYAVGGRQFAALAQAIAAAKEHGATPLLVDVPAFERHLAEALPAGDADLRRYHSELARLADNAGIGLLTIEGMAHREEYFVDFYHMNERGAATLTRQIADWIATEIPSGALTTCT